jgi:hypothetical protein
MNVQHVNVKIFAATSAIDLGDAIPVFHRWIQERLSEEMLVDVADYRHVPSGPGVILIGHQANYSLDCAANRLGLLYNRKVALEGGTQDKLLQAFYAALVACRRLEDEPPFRGRLRFDAGRCEVIVNDRLLAPNTDETWDLLRPELERFFSGLLGAGAFNLERIGEPRERFGVAVRSRAPLDVRSLLESFQAA